MTARKKIEKPKRKRQKQYNIQGWGPVVPEAQYGETNPSPGSIKPTPALLVRSYEDIAYSCVKLKADYIGLIRINHYTEDETTRDVQVRAVQPHVTKRILAERRLKGFTIREIVRNSSVLDLLHENPFFTKSSFLQMIVIFLEITGDCFLYKNFVFDEETQKLVGELQLLPSQFVTIMPDTATGFVKGYNYSPGFGGGGVPRFFTPEEVIHLKHPSCTLPYHRGYGPTEAIWKRLNLQNREVAYLTNCLKNFCRPDSTIMPVDNVPLSQRSVKELAQKWYDFYSLENVGAPLILNRRLEIKPLQYPLSEFNNLFAVWSNIKTAICNAYGVPPQVWELGNSNRASADAVLFQFSTQAIRPLISYIVEVLNRELVYPFFPDEFLEAVDYIPEDEAMLLAERIQYLDRDVLKVNEVRQYMGLEPVPWGDERKPVPGTFAPTQSFSQQNMRRLSKRVKVLEAQDRRVEEFLLKGYAPEYARLFAQTKDYRMPVSPAPLASAIARFYRRLEKEFLRKLKSRKKTQFIDVEETTDEMTEDLFPIVRSYYDVGVRDFVSRYELAPALLQHPNIDKACQKLTFDFCESTLQSVSGSVNDALTRLHEELAEGFSQNDLRLESVKRVKEIFTGLSDEHAHTISETETSRAIHDSQYITAKESGAIKRKGWLLSANACPVCQGIVRSRPVVDLDDNFAVLGDGPYADVPYPPAHPSCRCSLTYFRD